MAISIKEATDRLNDFIGDVRTQLDDALEQAFNEYDEPKEIETEWRRQIKIKNIRGQYQDFIEEIFGKDERASAGSSFDNVMREENFIKYPYRAVPIIAPLFILPPLFNKAAFKLMNKVFSEEEDIRERLTNKNRQIIQMIQRRTERIILSDGKLPKERQHVFIA